jgi:DNA-binding beta-propeller fold protein YncE
MSIRTDWKRIFAAVLSLAVLGMFACGGGGSNAPVTSGLTKRAFVSDDVDGRLHIEDAQNDIESASRISTGSRPGAMRLSPDKSITLVFNAGSSALAVVTNSTESLLGSIFLPNSSTSYVSMSDNTVGFAAVPNCPLTSCNGSANVVEVVNLATTFNITGTVPIAQVARTLVLSPTGSKLLVFGGPADHQETLTVVDTATAIGSTPAAAATLLSGFDRPVSAVFSSDGSKAYVLNCGAECGGTAASVSVLDLSTNTTSAPIPLLGATTGLLSGNTLYVAGSPPGLLAGRLSVLDTTALVPPASSVPISDGFHNRMELASNNKLFIGAAPTCTAGCLTIFDTSNDQAAVDPTTGNVTGIAPINGRNVVYVVEDVAAGSSHCQGQLPCLGKLRIYDTTASVPTLTPTQIDVAGKAVDVKYVDQ